MQHLYQLLAPNANGNTSLILTYSHLQSQPHLSFPLDSSSFYWIKVLTSNLNKGKSPEKIHLTGVLVKIYMLRISTCPYVSLTDEWFCAHTYQRLADALGWDINNKVWCSVIRENYAAVLWNQPADEVPGHTSLTCTFLLCHPQGTYWMRRYACDCLDSTTEDLVRTYSGTTKQLVH